MAKKKKSYYKKKTGKRPTMTSSAAIAAGAGRKRLRHHLILTDTKQDDEVQLIDSSDVRFEIPKWQRVQVTNWVNDLIVILMAGGKFPAPVHANIRPSDQELWWIIDGQQRYWAHRECKLPVRVIFHHLDTEAEERILYQILNAHRQLTANAVVEGSETDMGRLMRAAGTAKQSPLYGRIISKGRPACGEFSISVLTKGCCSVLIGGPARGSMNTQILPRCEGALLLNGGREKINSFFNLMATVWPEGINEVVKPMPVQALGIVASRRWRGKQLHKFPTKAQLRRIQVTKWESLIPKWTSRWMVVLTQHIEGIWRA